MPDHLTGGSSDFLESCQHCEVVRKPESLQSLLQTHAELSKPAGGCGFIFTTQHESVSSNGQEGDKPCFPKCLTIPVQRISSLQNRKTF